MKTIRIEFAVGVKTLVRFIVKFIGSVNVSVSTLYGSYLLPEMLSSIYLEYLSTPNIHISIYLNLKHKDGQVFSERIYIFPKISVIQIF